MIEEQQIEHISQVNIKYEFTKSNYRKNTTIHLVGSGGNVGWARIQGDTFKPGCTLRIKSTHAKSTRSRTTDGDCFRDGTLASDTLTITISEPCSSNDFDHAVGLRLYAKVCWSSIPLRFTVDHDERRKRMQTALGFNGLIRTLGTVFLVINSTLKETKAQCCGMPKPITSRK